MTDIFEGRGVVHCGGPQVVEARRWLKHGLDRGHYYFECGSLKQFLALLVAGLEEGLRLGELYVRQGGEHHSVLFLEEDA